MLQVADEYACWQDAGRWHVAVQLGRGRRLIVVDSEAKCRCHATEQLENLLRSLDPEVVAAKTLLDNVRGHRR